MMNDTEFENILKQALRPDISDEEILVKKTPSKSKRRKITMKIRRILSVFLLTVLMVSLMLTPQAYALPALEIKAKAAVLVDADEGRIIFGQNEQEREYPASITKVMTALLTLEAVDQGKLALDQELTATASALGIVDGAVAAVRLLSGTTLKTT